VSITALLMISIFKQNKFNFGVGLPKNPQTRENMHN